MKLLAQKPGLYPDAAMAVVAAVEAAAVLFLMMAV